MGIKENTYQEGVSKYNWERLDGDAEGTQEGAAWLSQVTGASRRKKPQSNGGP